MPAESTAEKVASLCVAIINAREGRAAESMLQYRLLATGDRGMGELFQTIGRLVTEGRYVVGQHAAERLEERGIMEWQAVAGLEDGELIVERPRAKTNPAIGSEPSSSGWDGIQSGLVTFAAKRRGEARNSAFF